MELNKWVISFLLLFCTIQIVIFLFHKINVIVYIIYKFLHMVAVWWWKIYYQHWNLGPGYFCPPIGSRIGAGEICDICFEWGTVGVVIPFPLGGNKHQLRHNLFTFPIIISNEPLFFLWLIILLPRKRYSCFSSTCYGVSSNHVVDF